MDSKPAPFVPPAPVPRTTPPSLLQMMRIVYRNPLELWGEPSYRERWLTVSGVGGPLLIANDPGLIRHVLVDNAKNYKMATVRQSILRPILRDGLLTAEGAVWKRSRKAMAPVFTPRHNRNFAQPMLERSLAFAERYENAVGPVDLARDMTALTYEILAETLFSGEIAGEPGSFEAQIDRLFETMGRVDPLDLLRAPAWLPRFTQIRGRKTLAYFRKIVSDTMEMRRQRMIRSPEDVPEDFLTLLLRAEGPDGLTRGEVEDNIITFIGAGHETTARALGWTLYCLAEAPWERERIEAEIDQVVATIPDPVNWLDAMPFTRAAFEEAMRLYPPAPSLNREPIEDDRYGDLHIKKGTQVLMMPWTVHRHRALWDRPDAFMPERFHPENRDTIDR
ncbi:MAG TPA: cytochrome P450, partial [Tianweitania sediminis]|nr:cytochrome P450 [Tianweitania sediminis]